MRDLKRGHAALRIGRVSLPGREYFLTICTDQKRVGLTAIAIAPAIIAEARAMDADSTWQLRCMTIMPDHVHLVVILGDRLSLGKSIARLKAKSSASLRSRAVDWERDFFDHHVDPDEDRLTLFLYVYLNPYRAGLCARTEKWPWFYCRDQDWAWLKDWLNAERPRPEWLV